MSINKFNSGHMYDLLVNDNNDIVGLFAYILYKQEKIAYIKKVNKNKSIQDKDAEIKKWKETKCTSTVINNYRNLAKKQANDFGASYSKKMGNDLEKKAKTLDDKEKKLNKKEIQLKKSSFHGFWYGVGQGVVASFAIPIIIAIVSFYLDFNSDNFSKACSAFFEALTKK